jgi:hypothetical protein
MDAGPRAYPPDDQRVSDTDRDHAVSELSEAFEVGRITADEFDQRSGRALSARTGKELTDLFTDLQKDNGTAAGRLARSPRAVGTLIALGTSGAAATSLAFLTLVNALTAGTNPGLTLAEREARRTIAEQVLNREGISISVPLPPLRCLRHRLGRHSNASGHHRRAHRADHHPLARGPHPPRLVRRLQWVPELL